MYHTQPRNPNSFSNNKKLNAALQKVQEASERDGDKLSPVNLDIKEALAVQLPSLVWTDYHVTPELMTVRNSGFTVMINARFDGEVPSVSGGPLMGNYSFSQVHFHWGEHDDTGSGHAVDGNRYPLEMHVVHLKKDCANLGEAFQRKDGIAVMVHLFAVREERNADLDQLTAILQFIQRPRCCARLYPTPLSEIIHPFTQDYLLYWGAVGSPSGQHRILWFISRNVLPVSTHQLEEFRQLQDPQGKLLVSNSSKPQPLAGRSLFLVSPSERINETMYGVSRRATQSVLGSEESAELRDAEFKSMADLEDNDTDFDDEQNCRICPTRRKPARIAKPTGYTYRINEGDTSIEESCVDLAGDAGVTVQTEMKCQGRPTGPKVVTNVNVTTCNHKDKFVKRPSEAVYSVVSARGSELHLKRQPMIVRQNDSSREQACMYLSQPPTYPTFSAPSLTATVGGPLDNKQEHTNLSDSPITNLSSEIAVVDTDSEAWLGDGRKQQPMSYNRNIENFEEEITHESFINTQKTKKVRIKQYDDVENNVGAKPKEAERPQKNLQTQSNLNAISQTPVLDNIDEYYFKEEDTTEETYSQYLIVKEIKNDKPLFKVVGTLQKGSETKNYPKNLTTNSNSKDDKQKLPIVKNLAVKAENMANQNDKYNPASYVHEESEFYKETDYKDKYQRKVIFKGIPNSFSPLNSKPAEIPVKQNKESSKFNKQDQVLLKNKNKVDQEDDPHCRVSLLVRTTVSDHRKLPNKEKLGKEYYVTKISPIENQNYITPIGSETDIKKCDGKKVAVVKGPLFYARPVQESSDNNYKGDVLLPNKSKQPTSVNEYYKVSKDELLKEHKKTLYINKYIKNDFNNLGQKVQPQETQSPQKNSTHNNNKTNEVEEYEYSEESNERKRTQHKDNYQRQTDNVNQGKKNETKENLKSAVQTTSKRGDLVKSNEQQLDKYLTEKVNVYHKETEEGGEVYMAEKTIAGKMGKTQSTDVFADNKILKTTEPQKLDLTKDFTYVLRKSKHPETVVSMAESSDGLDPKTIIRQQLTLDQKIKGRTEVKQTVEYHDKRKNNKTEPPIDTDWESQTRTYEEKNYEKSSTVKKSQLNKESSKKVQQNADLIPFNREINMVTNDIKKEKEDLSNKCAVDLQKLLPANHLEKKDPEHNEQGKLERGSSNEVVSQPITNNYEFMEQSSENEQYKHTKNKTVITNNMKTSSYPSRPMTNVVQETRPMLPSQTNVTDGEHNLVLETQVVPSKKDNNLKDTVFNKKMPSVQNGENNKYEESFEESTTQSISQKTKQKVVRTIVKGETVYKVPGIEKPPNNETESNEIICVKKVEIPEPHFITRLPKQPLTEFEAFPVNPHQPFEVMTETFEETSSVVKTNKTFMVFKKINGLAVLNQPSVKDQIKDENSQNQDNIVPSAQFENTKPSNEFTELKQNNTVRNTVVPQNSLSKNTQETKESSQQVINSPQSEKVLKPQMDKEFYQYHYSESSMVSEQTHFHKEKKYRYTIQQPGLSELPENLPISIEDHKLQLDQGTPSIQNWSKNKNEKGNDKPGEEDDTDQSKRKMVVGSYQLQKALNSATSKIPKQNEANQIVKQDENVNSFKNNYPYSNTDKYFNIEEYHESSDKEHRSTQKRVISIKGGPTIKNNHVFSNSLTGGNQNKYSGIQDTPTKDFFQKPLTNFKDEYEPVSESFSGEKDNGTKQPGMNRNESKFDRGHNFDVDKSSSPIIKNGTNSSLPLSKTDGDIVIYIRQPRDKKKRPSS